jgi:hypothetical protein
MIVSAPEQASGAQYLNPPALRISAGLAGRIGK